MNSFSALTLQAYIINSSFSGCVLLYFSYADFEEQNMKFDKVSLNQ